VTVFLEQKIAPPVVTDARQLRSVDHSLFFLTTPIHLSSYFYAKKKGEAFGIVHTVSVVTKLCKPQLWDR
jgi:hypothetical protein